MYKKILHATDLSDTHFQICARANDLAHQLGAKLYLLHVINLPPGVQLSQGLGFTELAYPSKEDALIVMGCLGEALDIPVSQQFVEIGSVEEQIFKKVAQLQCDLVIIGSHQAEGFSGFLNTSHTILKNAACDVLTLYG